MANWDKRFMDLARHISTWSKDTSTKLGAVVVDDDNTILSVGYNGFCRCANDELKERYERPQKYLYTEHAERNCIYNAVRSGTSLKGSKMYVPFFPCIDCARAIINSGIKTLITYEPDFEHERWGESFKIAYEMFKECGVNVIIFSDEYDEFYKELEYCLKLEWDYKVPSDFAHFLSEDTKQENWNQTLLTKLNQAGANIHQKNMRCGANKVRCGKEIFSIIQSFEYFDKSTMSLGTRYDIIIDNNIPKDEIVVYYDRRLIYSTAITHDDEELKKIQKEKEKKENYVLIKILNFE